MYYMCMHVVTRWGEPG